MLPSTDDIKMRQAIWNKKSDYAILARTGFAQKPGKRGSVICRIQYDQGEKFSPNPPTRWVKKRYPLLFSKYEIH